MKTTREINVNLDKGQTKLNQMTTKTIDTSIKIEHPKEPIKAQFISTTTLQDVADIAEKKRRDEIMAERKAMRESVEITKSSKTVDSHPVSLTHANAKSDIEKMEKNIAMKKRMAKARAAKKGKKK